MKAIQVFFIMLLMGNCIYLGIAIEQNAGVIFFSIWVIASLIGLLITTHNIARGKSHEK